jgi:Ca-activated chloride channel family protein
MKKNANIIVLAFAFLALQACGSKSNETKPEVTTSTPVTQVKALTVKEKREKLEKERMVREARIRHDREELVRAKVSYIDAKGNVIYYMAELQPMYKGGDAAMSKYLNDNLEYPEQARKDGSEGTVFVDFVVAKDGTVREIKISDAYNLDIDQSFRDEAYRVVSSMPRWTPGSQHGKDVDVEYSLPITFELR